MDKMTSIQAEVYFGISERTFHYYHNKGVLNRENRQFFKEDILKKLGIDSDLDEPLINANEAAEILSCSIQKINNICCEGLIPYYRFAEDNGAHRFFKRQEIEALRNNDYLMIGHYFEQELLKSFMESFIDVNQKTGTINYRMADIIKDLLKQKDLNILAGKRGITRTRIRQLLTKALLNIRGFPNHINEIIKERDKYFEKYHCLKAEHKTLAKHGREDWLLRKKAGKVSFDYNILKTEIKDLDLSVRAYNCLNAAKLRTVHDIVQLNISDLLKFRNFGKKTVREVEDAILDLGLTFNYNKLETP